MMLTTHAQAREYARGGFALRFGADPNEWISKILAGVAWLETCYSNAWALTKKDPALNPKNQGAIQCGSSWKYASFAATDTHPNADGSNTPYPAAFRLYADFVRANTTVQYPGGWDDLAQVAYSNRGRSVVLDAARAGDVYQVSALLHSTGYYEGWGPTVEVRVQHHYRALCKAIATADAAIGEPPQPVPSPLIKIPPTVQFGDEGPIVKRLQWELQVAADGKFGPMTRDAVMHYQLMNHLTVNGVVGLKTWYALLTDDYIPPELAA